MPKDEFLKAGAYFIRVTLEMEADVYVNEETEDGLIADCRRTGEMVDWDVQKIGGE